MSVTREDVLQIAALARLRLEDAEVERLTVQLNDILGHVEALAEVGEGAEVADVGEGAESGAGAEAGAGWRVDWAAPQREDAEGADPLHRSTQAFAPDFRDGFFVVPRLGAMEAGNTAEVEVEVEVEAEAEAEAEGGPARGSSGAAR